MNILRSGKNGNNAVNRIKPVEESRFIFKSIVKIIWDTGDTNFILGRGLGPTLNTMALSFKEATEQVE